MALRGVFLVVASVLLTGEERQGTLVSEAFRGFNHIEMSALHHGHNPLAPRLSSPLTSGGLCESP